MLLDRVTALTSSLSAHLQAKAAGEQATVFKTRAQQYSEACSRLQAAIDAWRTLSGAGIDIERPAALSGARRQVEALRATFAENPASFEEADPSVRQVLIPAIRKHADAISADALKAWQLYVDNRVELPRRDILEVLEPLPGFKQHVQQIRAEAAKISELRQSVPTAQTINACLDTLSHAKKVKDEALAAMTGDGIPAAVLKFLRDANSYGASLTDYTDEVRIWLHERNLGAAFRIVSNRA